jgi:hypothetical protein
MGNMIPPSGVILASLACYNKFSGIEMEQSTFWIVSWGIAFWFILQRLATVFVFCRIYKVKALPKEEIPRFRESLKEGWKNLLLPVIILIPFVVDYLFKSFKVVGFLLDMLKNRLDCFFAESREAFFVFDIVKQFTVG